MGPDTGEQRRPQKNGNFAEEVANLVFEELFIAAEHALVKLHAAFEQDSEEGLFALACQPFAVVHAHIGGAAGEASALGIIETRKDGSFFEIVCGNH